MLINHEEKFIFIIEFIDKWTSPFGASVIFFIILVMIICALIFASMFIHAIVSAGIYKVSELYKRKPRTGRKKMGKDK